ncbi:MAG: glycosyltransferase family 9 protein [Desulfoplanes sp.]
MNSKNISHINPKRILICQLRQIGDVVLTTHIIQLLKQRFPNALVDFLTEKKCAPVLENNPYLAEIKILDKKKLTSFAKELACYWKIARNGYDMVIDFQQLPRCRFVVLFSRANIRLTYHPPWYNRMLYTHWATMDAQHPVERKAQILSPLGIVWNREKPRIFLTNQEKKWAAQELGGLSVGTDDILVTVDPTHHSATRRWPAPYFGKLINSAVQQDNRLKFYILYGPGEKECADRVAQAAHSPDHCFVPDRILSLREMAAIIQKADLHLGNCSAPRHFAVALDTPSLTILGSEGQGWTFPSPEHTHIFKGLPCQPCKSGSCSQGNRPCLTELMPEEVLPELLKKIELT